VVGGRLRRPCCIGRPDFGVCCRNRASPGVAYGCCSGEVSCGKQKPQADGEVGCCRGREGGSPALVGGGEEGREQSHCRCAGCSSQGQTCEGGGQLLGRRRRRYPSLQAFVTSLHQRRQDDGVAHPPSSSLQDEGLRRRPTTKSSHPTSPPNLEAHVGFSPL
jgi:hypothetical protein